MENDTPIHLREAFCSMAISQGLSSLPDIGRSLPGIFRGHCQSCAGPSTNFVTPKLAILDPIVTLPAKFLIYLNKRKMQ